MLMTTPNYTQGLNPLIVTWTSCKKWRTSCVWA